MSCWSALGVPGAWLCASALAAVAHHQLINSLSSDCNSLTLLLHWHASLECWHWLPGRKAGT